MHAIGLENERITHLLCHGDGRLVRALLEWTGCTTILFLTHILDDSVSKPIRRIALRQFLTLSAPVPTPMAPATSEQTSGHNGHFDDTSILMKKISKGIPRD